MQEKEDTWCEPFSVNSVRIATSKSYHAFSLRQLSTGHVDIKLTKKLLEHSKFMIEDEFIVKIYKLMKPEEDRYNILKTQLIKQSSFEIVSGGNRSFRSMGSVL